MDLREALRSTAAIRVFTDRPVSDETIAAILDDARFAPSGGNRQPWRIAVLKDRAVRRSLADAMQPVWDDYMVAAAAGQTPFTAVPPAGYTPPTDRPPHAPNPLLTNIESIPVVLAVAADLSRIALMDKDLDRPAVAGGASIYPFCWSILLAAREHDLGGVITTFATRVEPITGPLLGLPADHVLAAVIFLGHPERRPTKLKRSPVVTTIDRFDGPPLSYD